MHSGNFHDLPIGKNAPHVVSCYIEVPRGSVNKYEYEEHTQMLCLDRVLHSSVSYPGDYGFIPQTSAEDGDPLDVIILSNFTLLPNSLADCRVVGMMEMTDEKGHDAKVIAVVDSDPRSAEIMDIDDVPGHVKKEIAHFFRTYKDLEQGKWVEIRAFLPRAAAVREVQLCHKRYFAQHFHPFQIGERMPSVVQAFVEVQKHSFNKYVWDSIAGILKLDRTLHSTISYPGDYGFIPETARDDGEPLDILILSTFTLQPGVLVDVRVVGVIDMVDEKGSDQKILAVVDCDPRVSEILDIDDVSGHRKKEIAHFFQTYKDLEVAKFVEMKEWGDRAMAQALISEANRKYLHMKSGSSGELDSA